VHLLCQQLKKVEHILLILILSAHAVLCQQQKDLKMHVDIVGLLVMYVCTVLEILFEKQMNQIYVALVLR
jgi:hypothetical protein